MRIKLFILFVLAGSSLWAQDRSPAVEEAVAQQVARFELRADQVEKMYTIEERRARNLAEIESLRESDYRLFLQKRMIIRNHAEGNMRQILDKEQRLILNESILERREMAKELSREMQAQGKSKEEIGLILLERG